MTVNVPQPVVTLQPGSTAAVKLDVQRMIDGAGDYTVTGTSSDGGITVAPASGHFAADGSATVDVPITAQSVPDENYLVSLTTSVGHSTRRSLVLVVVAQPEE